MKIIIKSEPKEIAELVSALQERSSDKTTPTHYSFYSSTYTPSCPCKCCGKANETHYSGVGAAQYFPQGTH